MRVKKNDTVLVIAGDDIGKMGKVLKVFPKESRLIVEGINFIKRHTRPSQRGQQGGIVEKEAPIHVSNVMVHCPKCAQPARIGHRVLQDGSKARLCRRCGEMLE